MDGAVKVVIQLSEGEEARMAQALNNAANLTRYYAERGFALVIEVVCFGPGVSLLRADRTPFAARVAELAGRPVHFSACANTLHGLAQHTLRLFSSHDAGVDPGGLEALWFT